MKRTNHMSFLKPGKHFDGPCYGILHDVIHDRVKHLHMLGSRMGYFGTNKRQTFLLVDWKDRYLTECVWNSQIAPSFCIAIGLDRFP